MFKYCLKVFDSEERIKIQLIVPADDLFHYLDNLSSYGTVKGYIVNEDDN